jgi:NAD+ diphosphatase
LFFHLMADRQNKNESCAFNMINNTDNHRYNPAYIPNDKSNETIWNLAFIGKKLLMTRGENGFSIPLSGELENIRNEFSNIQYIGEFDGHGCFCMQSDKIDALPGHLELVDLREIAGLTGGDMGLFTLAGTAAHILHWNRNNQYCGRCGQKTADKADERAKICPSCGNVVYSRISPATITAIIRGDEILLAHNRNFKDSLYSLVAGFVEPGETLEQCAAREIYEEVGLKVRNIKYFCSQPWPFPDSLMMAFTAEFESGVITVDNFEITDAAWFKADSLPLIPSSDSVAGRIIRWFRDSHTNNLK